MQDYITKMTDLKRSFNVTIAEARNYTNPDLSAEGLAKRRADLAAAATADHKAQLEQLTRDLQREAADTKNAAQAQLPPAPADTSQAWGKVKMLLDAGRSLHQIVENAEPAVLHAITEWGPTYLEAESYKGRTDGWAPVAVDPAPLHRSISQRWGQVLGGTAAERIKHGAEAEAMEAQFNVTAEHFGSKLDGVPTGRDDMTAAIEARLAGKNAASTLATFTKGIEVA